MHLRRLLSLELQHDIRVLGNLTAFLFVQGNITPDNVILIVFEIVIRARAPAAFRRISQVLELQEIRPFAPEAQKGGRESPGQGHQTLGA